MFWNKTPALFSKVVCSLYKHPSKNSLEQRQSVAHKMCTYSGDPWRTYPTPTTSVFLCSISLLPYFISLLGKCRKHIYLSTVCKTLLEEFILHGNTNVHLLAHEYILQFGSKNSTRLQCPVVNLDVSEATQAQWNCTAHLAYA